LHGLHRQRIFGASPSQQRGQRRGRKPESEVQEPKGSSASPPSLGGTFRAAASPITAGLEELRCPNHPAPSAARPADPDAAGRQFGVNLLEREAQGIEFEPNPAVRVLDEATVEIVERGHCPLGSCVLPSASSLPSKIRMSWMTDASESAWIPTANSPVAGIKRFFANRIRFGNTLSAA
jgi:hypothetical protein